MNRLVDKKKIMIGAILFTLIFVFYWFFYPSVPPKWSLAYLINSSIPSKHRCNTNISSKHIRGGKVVDVYQNIYLINIRWKCRRDYINYEYTATTRIQRKGFYLGGILYKFWKVLEYDIFNSTLPQEIKINYGRVLPNHLENIAVGSDLTALELKGYKLNYISLFDMYAVVVKRQKKSSPNKNIIIRPSLIENRKKVASVHRVFLSSEKYVKFVLSMTNKYGEPNHKEKMNDGYYYVFENNLVRWFFQPSLLTISSRKTSSSIKWVNYEAKKEFLLIQQRRKEEEKKSNDIHWRYYTWHDAMPVYSSKLSRFIRKEKFSMTGWECFVKKTERFRGRAASKLHCALCWPGCPTVYHVIAHKKHINLLSGTHIRHSKIGILEWLKKEHVVQIYGNKFWEWGKDQLTIIKD